MRTHAAVAATTCQYLGGGGVLPKGGLPREGGVSALLPLSLGQYDRRSWQHYLPLRSVKIKSQFGEFFLGKHW